MSNIADLIEDYILRRLAAEQNRKVELKAGGGAKP